MTKTSKTKAIARVRPHKEERDNLQCKKSVRKNPAKKVEKAAKGKPAIKINAKDRKILENLQSFHKERSMIQSDSSPEYTVYDGVILDDSSPATTGTSSIQKAIYNFDAESFFKCD